MIFWILFITRPIQSFCTSIGIFDYAEYGIGQSAVTDYQKECLVEAIEDQGPEILRMLCCFLLRVQHFMGEALTVQMDNGRHHNVVCNIRWGRSEVIDRRV